MDEVREKVKSLLWRGEHDFIPLLATQAEFTSEGMKALQSYAESGAAEYADAVMQLEQEADDFRRALIKNLSLTYITDLDREDIHALSRALDAVLNYAATTVEEMALFKLEADPWIRSMMASLAAAADELRLAMENLQRQKAISSRHALRAKAYENEVERTYREALSHLFDQADTVQDIVRILKLRETYRHLSNAADRVDEAANLITDIIVKMG